MECKRKVRELSPVLLISTNTSSEDYVDFWRRQLSTHEVRPDAQTNSFGSVPESPSEKKRCRYGEDCRNKLVFLSFREKLIFCIISVFPERPASSLMGT